MIRGGVRSRFPDCPQTGGTKQATAALPRNCRRVISELIWAVRRAWPHSPARLQGVRHSHRQRFHAPEYHHSGSSEIPYFPTWSAPHRALEPKTGRVSNPHPLYAEPFKVDQNNGFALRVRLHGTNAPFRSRFAGLSLQGCGRAGRDVELSGPRLGRSYGLTSFVV